jgi:hypothetical protein
VSQFFYRLVDKFSRLSEVGRISKKNVSVNKYLNNLLPVEVVMNAEENMRLMKILDDSWNSQDWDTFSKRHAEDLIVRWPGQTEPTRGLNAHRNEGVQMFNMFPDNHVENNKKGLMI